MAENICELCGGGGGVHGAMLCQNCLVPDRQIEQLQADNDKLKEFARSVIQIECWGCYEPDGLGTQDLAEKLGLVKSHIVTEEDVNDDFEAGDIRYKFTDILKGGE